MGLELVEILKGVEDKFDLQFPEDDRLSNCRTYGDLIDYFVAAVREQDSTIGELESTIDKYVSRLLITEYSVAPEHIVREEELFGPNLNLG
ncbi:MAG: hypothetical protein O3B86_13140 [Planctomycetota bacterium]|nr:hypothetical protein [Planctomycetota bacterium]